MPPDQSDFESRRFRTAAAHYLSGRPPYSARLIGRVAGICGVTQQDRVIDLGCGPGQLARAFAPYALDILAIDPEPEMLGLGQAGVEAGGPANITWLRAAAADLNRRHGPARLVTMGRSFHWMDRPDTLRRLDGIIVPGGAVALFHDRHPDVPENAWRTPYKGLLDRYSEDDSTRQQRRGPSWIPHISILLGSAFSELEEVAAIEQVQTSRETLIDRALSLSSTSRARLGARADQLVHDLDALLHQIAPSGTVDEVVASYALIARRPAAR